MRCLSGVGVGAGVGAEAWLALGFGELSAYGWGWLGTPREGIWFGIPGLSSGHWEVKGVGERSQQGGRRETSAQPHYLLSHCWVRGGGPSETGDEEWVRGFGSVGLLGEMSSKPGLELVRKTRERN